MMKVGLGILYVLALLVLLLVTREAAGDPSGTRCEAAPGREETCVCKTEGGVIDLTPFSNKDETPRYGMAVCILWTKVWVQVQ